MLIRLDDCQKKEAGARIGNKAWNLMQLVQNGFEVPPGIVLECGVYEELLRESGVSEEVESLLSGIEEDKISEISGRLREIAGGLRLRSEIKSGIETFLRPDRLYAVRSSGLLEDGESFSFAGLYESVLEVQGIDAVERAVIRCFSSLFSERILQYLKDHAMDVSKLKMAVIIQEMVEAEYSGVAFTVDPVSGRDTRMLIEMAEGLGERLVSGQVNPRQYFYDWKEKRFEEEENIPSEIPLREMGETFLRIQKLYGHPCDIEFALKEGKLHILQSRAITRLRYAGIRDLWSTADFKDGGVSATVCTPFMWSLYEYVWNHALSEFIIRSKILPPEDCRKPLGEMFYGRPYWNLSFVKKAMSRIPGYKERDFDATYGIAMNYEGDGETTGINLSSLWRILRIALAQKRILSERQKSAEPMKETLLNRYEEYRTGFDERTGDEAVESSWYRLTKEDYLESESFYFRQIFINTVHQSLNKDALTKYVSDSDYLALMSGISDISHLRPFYDIWSFSRQIRSDREAFDYWQNHTDRELAEEIGKGRAELRGPEEFIESYGYHSDKELDVTYPCYAEDRETVIRMFRENIGLEDSCSPQADQQRQAALFAGHLEKLKTAAGDKKYAKLKKTVETMREMLWWREEFRDLSSRFYYIIRIYTLKLAQLYETRGIIERAEDIWMLKIGDLWRYMEGKLGESEIRAIVEKNRDYYDSFRNFQSENEIGAGIGRTEIPKISDKNRLSGLGAGSGAVTARAKLVLDMRQMDRLEVGDILVTKYTDTGWTSKFAMLSGVVTEYGGVLCHAAIVSREYGIPCVVAAKGALSRIRDGALIRVNGETGEIEILEE